MSDVWECRHELNPRSANDAGQADVFYNADSESEFMSFAEFAPTWTTDMPGIYRNPDSSLSNFLGDDTDVDVHHLVEWRFFKELKPEWKGWTKAQCNEMMPGVMLEVGHHRKLYGALKAIENGIADKSSSQILAEMKIIYEQNDAGHLWPVVQRWCASHGITAP